MALPVTESEMDRATKVALDKKGYSLPQRRHLCTGLFRRLMRCSCPLLRVSRRDRAELVSVSRAKDEKGYVRAANVLHEACGTGSTETATLVVMGATDGCELLDGFVAAPFTAGASRDEIMRDRLLRECV